LIQAGYQLVDTVYDHGEFAVRGSIVDVYASGQEAPIRIDLFDDEIETLKYFDPETQRTTQTIKAIPNFTCKRISFQRSARVIRDRYAEISNCKSKEKPNLSGCVRRNCITWFGVLFAFIL
jgi:transcription-repair coupling factor (superfamily II helicase)